MLLRKTDKARAALHERTRTLGAVERRILILCDGRRGQDELERLLGAAIGPALERLRGEGYLEALPQSSPLTARVRSAARELLGASGATATGRASVHPSPAPAPASVIGPPPARRSLVAAKMYVLDMLQLQRSAEAAELRMAIQTASGDEPLLQQVLRAMEYFRAETNGSYAARIGERLTEVLPEVYLPHLQPLLRDELPATAS